MLKNLQVILTGMQNFKDGLWDISLPTNDILHDSRKNQKYQNKLNIILPKNKTQTDLARFYHATICSPVPRTLQMAIRNDHFLSWPGIDKINFEKFIVNTVAINKGHLDHERKNLRPTSKYTTSDTTDLFPTAKAQYPISKSYGAYSKIVPFMAKELAYGNITGAFPYTSSCRSKYIYVM